MIGIYRSAIILGPPPKPLLDRWFASITQHLTKDQLKAPAARQNCGKHGRRAAVTAPDPNLLLHPYRLKFKRVTHCSHTLATNRYGTVSAFI